VTSEAQARPREEDEAVASDEPGDQPTGASGPGTPDREVPGDTEPGRERGGRPSVPLAPTLLVLLLVLLVAGAFLWFTRPGESALRTDDYAEALQAARSGIVDLTSFDYLTLDDDIEQVRRVATGDLEEATVDRLDTERQQITDLKAVWNTEVVGAGVTRADGEDATVLLVIQSTQESAANPQAQIVRYRIEVSLEKEEGRWLLSGIKGTGGPGDD
jgi:Mce-associated membrane protein